MPVLDGWRQQPVACIPSPRGIAREPKTGKHNVGMYRMQVYDAKTAGMHWQRQKIGAEHYRQALRAAAAVSANQNADEGVRATQNRATQNRATQASAAVDIMARSSGGAMLAEGARPAGKMEVAVAI